MKLSAKGRYALAAMITMGQEYGRCRTVTVISLSQRLGVSKIYLEQVFALLKRAGLVSSIKGAQGGYQLARPPREISTLDVLSATELSLLEKSGTTVVDKAPEIDAALEICVFDPLTRAVEAALRAASIADLMDEAERNLSQSDYMFYI